MSLIDTSENWFRRLESLLVPSLDLKTGTAFIKYLADLGIFENVDQDQWALKEELESQNGNLNLEQLQDRLLELSTRGEGMELSFFLVNPGPVPQLSNESDEREPVSEDAISQPSSNLSNLQLVKKMGRQLSPFIEMEARLNKSFSGNYVGKKEARILTNFVISILKQKEAPREWEQLSRKRHK